MFRFLRYLPQTIAAVLVASVVWGQAFKGPDTKARGHTPIADNGFTIPINGQLPNSSVWTIPLSEARLFPANFLGSSLYGFSGAKCLGNSPTTSLTFLVKCNTVQIGQVVLAGPSGGVFVQQNTGTSSGTDVAIQLTNNVVLNNWIVAAYHEQSSSFNPTFSLCTSVAGACTIASTATIGSITKCPAGAPIQDSGGNASVQIAYAQVTGAGTLQLHAVLGGAEGQNMTLAEFSGLLSSPADGCGAGNTAGGVSATPGVTVLSTGSSTGTGATDLIIGAIAQNSNTAAALTGVTAGFTALTQTNQPSETGYTFYNLSTSAPVNVQGTAVVAGPWAGIALALKVTSGLVCSPTFTTTNGQAQLCPAGGILEVDGPALASGSNMGLTFPAITP